MVRNRITWKYLFLFALLVLNVFTKSLPIEKSLPASVVSHNSLPKLEINNFVGPEVISDETKNIKSAVSKNARPCNETVLTEDDGSVDVSKTLTYRTSDLSRNIRPGQTVQGYEVKISFDDNIFHGEVVIDLRPANVDDSIILHRQGLDIHDVRVGHHSVADAESVDYDDDDDEILEIFPNDDDNSYVVVIEYSGEISNIGKGIFQRDFNDHQYMAMYLFPTNARRVFPCIDELQAHTAISFTFEDVPFNNIVSNTRTEDDNSDEFRTINVSPHLWGMVAHDFIPVAMPATDVVLYGRSGLNQYNLAGIAINDFLAAYNEKLDKDYFDFDANQDDTLHIFALPDTNVEWNALSTICIWEPYIFMTNTHSMMQQKISLVKIAEAMARQWFGFFLSPADWRHQWVLSGLASHAAQDVVTEFQSSVNEDITLLDMNTIFTSDVIQEALLHDSYSSAMIISPENDIFDESEIRHHIFGLLKLKAPAIMRMLRIVLGDHGNDPILAVGQQLLNRRNPTDLIVAFDFVSALNRATAGNGNVDDVSDFLEPWIQNTGYPVLHVGWRSENVVLLTQEHFRFTGSESTAYTIPVTYTTNQQLNYDDVHPTMMMDNTIQITLPNTLDEDDYVIFNIQGQGYYRVNYDLEHWDRIISALDDPDRRQEIHPLNRASLIDDALNLARGGRLGYDVALSLVLTWEHETEYGPWKAFIRNMEFLKRGLLGAVSDDEDLDSNIYTRMIRRTIGTFEDEVSFNPDPSDNEPAMTSLTRGIVMDHACRSNYDPCIAAAIDWFYDAGSDDPAVNPNIPADIQPAVFCTMVQEAGVEAIDLLNDYLETVDTHYDRLVVLESLACSSDEGFINDLMMETISEDGRFGLEERSIILAAIIRSNFENVLRAMEFIRANVNNIRDMYGGPQKLEELLFILGDNIVNEGVAFDFRVWITSNGNNLDDSEAIAERALSNAEENVEWTKRSLDDIYEWIDENDAHTVIVSFTLLSFTALVSLFNL